jgi:hypothetical protein
MLAAPVGGASRRRSRCRCTQIGADFKATNLLSRNKLGHICSHVLLKNFFEAQNVRVGPLDPPEP